MSIILDKLKKAEELRKQERTEKAQGKQNNIKLGNEYKFRLQDEQVHSFTPVVSYNNGKYFGVITEDNNFNIMTAAQFKKLMDQNITLNQQDRTPNLNFEHDKTDNKQDKAVTNKKDLSYSSVTIYDTADDGDRYTSISIPVVMDSNGNIYHTNGQKFSRLSEELALDLRDDTSIFYEDWMHARGEPITFADKVADGIDIDVASSSAEGQTVPMSLRDLKDRAETEGVHFNTPYYSPEEVEKATEELEEKDIRWDN